MFPAVGSTRIRSRPELTSQADRPASQIRGTADNTRSSPPAPPSALRPFRAGARAGCAGPVGAASSRPAFFYLSGGRTGATLLKVNKRQPSDPAREHVEWGLGAFAIPWQPDRGPGR